jgi:gliding motility-associated-like protein
MSNCEDFTFEIYDRWGLLILKDKKQSFWDGRTSSGEEVTDGTYFYIMNTESGRKLKGTVTLFR